MISEKVITELIEFTKKEIVDSVSSNESSFTAKAYGIKNGCVGFCAMLPFTNDEEKVIMLEGLGELSQKQGYKQIVLVVDTYYRKAQSRDEQKVIFENWDTEQPRAYPKSMRQSAAVLVSLDMGQKNGLNVYLLPYKTNEDGLIFEKRMSDNTFNGVLCEAISLGYLKAILKDTVNFHKMSEETKEGKDPFDAMADNMVPLVSRIIDDYPFFQDSQAMENLQLLASPSGRIIAKENFMKRFESGEEGDFPWES